ncbi:sulfate adenylyltransferase subunit CysN [uncultured Endozoicomonas sp.]|uniref:sulfate adenylyltransferase subunit CysN n=1 Tax=uncultured Endozoicomonas sp. TaxID=432652 RepID=UPI00260D7C75|nr:sulfate adenylyltransferase subunit CysN [uncultured Endozoicomonas sp.]
MSHQSELIATDIDEYLSRHERKEMMRFLTCGSVDDGKSTLIGRLLHDNSMVYEDQLAAVENDSKRVGTQGEKIDLALLVDGLQAEREQGITIDVAYRYFSTEKRKYIIADTPGHEQYTRNMATGASSCDLAIILIDARQGVLTQTRRHTYIANLLGIKHLVVAINKMDLVDYRRERFEEIRRQYLDFAESLKLSDVQFVPISALDGDNVVHRSQHMSWYRDSSLMEILENVELSRSSNLDDFRFPIQYVNRPNLDFRGFSGTIASGTVRPGDEVKVLPSGQTSTVERIVTWDGDLPQGIASQAVTLTLTDEIDISRGDMLIHNSGDVTVSSTLDTDVVWMAEEPLSLGRQYLIKFAGSQISGAFSDISYRVDINSLSEHEADKLQLNEIGQCQLQLTKDIPADRYQDNRQTGAFIVIDRLSNATVAAGMVRGASKQGSDIKTVNQRERQQRLGQKGGVFEVPGQYAVSVERLLFNRGFFPVVINNNDEFLELKLEVLSNTETVILLASDDLSESEPLDLVRLTDQITQSISLVE